MKSKMEKLEICFVIFGIISTVCGRVISESSEIREFLEEICKNVAYGEMIPNTHDCESFIVCNYVQPVIMKCAAGLYYDPTMKMCNYPNLVKCEIIKDPSKVGITSKNTDNFESTDSGRSTSVQQDIREMTERNFDRTSTPPGVDFATGSTTIDHLEGYDPNHVRCIHDGLYFLPHPIKCELYFICENHNLHMHHCGSGIHWDYIEQQCDFPKHSRCYFNTVISGTSKPTATVPTTVKLTEKVSKTTIIHPVPTTTKNATEIMTSVKKTTAIKTTTRKVTPTPKPSPPTTTTVRSTTLKEVATTTPAKPAGEKFTQKASTPVTVADLLPDCPKYQAFLPHPRDCRKYFICIGGVPILTTCPDDLVWNAKELLCALPAYTECNLAP